MPKRIPSAEFIAILTVHGFEFVSQRGSHAKYRDANGHTVIIPHPRKDIPVGTLRSMIRQSGLPKELFD
jgi:predicted RNA binding protein YcfA (HicA-like mRNA interferase family)